MFTGIIEEIGNIKSIEYLGNILRLGIEAKKINSDLKKGDSVSVNGVCLTVVDIKKGCFFVEIMEETLNKTNIGTLKVSSKVNLERALKISDRLSGHIVTGHIDTVSVVKKVTKSKNYEITLAIPSDLMKFCVSKGSICVNGVSLTISKTCNSSIVLSLIPYTLENTNLQFLKVSDKVNIEFDYLGKYIVNYLEQSITFSPFEIKNPISRLLDFSENGDITCN